MSKKAIRSIILLMSISLIGLISFQAYWISQSIKKEVESFDRNMLHIVNEVGDKLVKQEAKLLFLKALPSSTNLANKLEDTNLTVKGTTSNVEFIGQPNRTIVVSNNGNKTTISTSTSGITSTITTDRVIEKYESKKNLLTEVIDEIAFEYAVENQSLVERIKKLDIDSFVTEQLIKSGFEGIRYGYQVINLANDSIIKSKGELYANFNHYEGELTEDGKLHFQVENKNLIAIKSLWLILLLSFILTSVLIGTFIYTINSILKQKRISTIKADFINNMTHEFKTPVATISLAIDSILHKENRDRPEEIDKLGGIIKKENARMNQQIESLLNIALFEKEDVELNITDTNVHTLISEIKESFAMKSINNLGDIAVFYNATKYIVRADKMHLYNAFRNIIDNGIKYSTENFMLKIETTNSEDSISILISDQGIGMNSETQRRVFDRFYRETSGNLHSTKGFGLGLSYVKEVVDKIGGEISVNSELGKGSSFIIKIPLA
jgi:two-component system phosphate regulon sensor histidine kinase PhoR